MKKTVSLRISAKDLEKLDYLQTRGLPLKSEQIRRIIRYYLNLNLEQQLDILTKGYGDTDES